MTRTLARIAVVSVSVVVFGACGAEEDHPTEPDRQVTAIDLTPDRAALQRDSVVDFDAEADDQSGNRIADVEFSWRVQDPTVATVNDTGLVRGLEAGETVVTASAEGQQDTAKLKVRSGQTEVMDSTEFNLVSDSTERAEGIFRFETSADAPIQEIEPGDILVGTEQGGFLRKVNGVSRSGTQVVVETEQASLTEAADSLFFESTITLGTGAAGEAVEKNKVQWGATYTRYAAPGVSAEEATLQINDLTLVNDEVCNSSGSNCAEVSSVIRSGRVQFTPEMDVAVGIGFFDLKRFRAVGSGNLTFDVSAETSASGELEKTGDKELYQFSKPFFYPGPPPLLGEVRLTFLAGYELDTEAEISLQTGFDSDYGVEVGAKYVNGTWSEVFSVNPSFDPHPIENELEGETRSRVFITSDVSLVFYTAAGPNLFVEPYLQGQATFADECVLDLTAGLDAGLGFQVEILSHDLTPFEKSLAIGSSHLASTNLGCGGSLEVLASTTGEDRDTDGYTVTVDGSASASIDPNGSTTFTNLEAGDHEIELSGIKSNCSVDGKNPRTVTITSGNAATENFNVECSAQISTQLEVKVNRDDFDATESDTVVDGESIVLKWESAGDVDECTSQGSWTGSKSPSGSETVGPLTGPDSLVYVLDCSNSSSSATDSSYVAVRSHDSFHAVSNRGDNTDAPQLRFIYAIPSNGSDQELDLGSHIDNTFGAFNRWFEDVSQGKKFRVDKYKGSYDVTFLRLHKSADEIKEDDLVSSLRTRIEKAGLPTDSTVNFVFFGENLDTQCGGASTNLVVLKTAGGGCFSKSDVPSSPEAPLSNYIFTAGHMLMHALGHVDANAPHSCFDIHVCEIPENGVEFMGPFINDRFAFLDFQRDDYYNNDGLSSQIPNLASSPYLFGSITSNPGNQPPEATLIKPTDGFSDYEGREHLFEARASDPDDGRLTTEVGDEWTSSDGRTVFYLDGDKIIGGGSRFSVVLGEDIPVGEHTIILKAIDRDLAVGLDSATIEVLDVTSRPEPPSNVEAEAISNSEVEVTWQDNSKTESRFEVEYRRTGNQDWTDARGYVGVDQTFDTVRELDADTSYDFRVKACNPEGCSASDFVTESTL